MLNSFEVVVFVVSFVSVCFEHCVSVKSKVAIDYFQFFRLGQTKSKKTKHSFREHAIRHTHSSRTKKNHKSFRPIETFFYLEQFFPKHNPKK